MPAVQRFRACDRIVRGNNVCIGLYAGRRHIRVEGRVGIRENKNRLLFRVITNTEEKAVL